VEQGLYRLLKAALTPGHLEGLSKVLHFYHTEHSFQISDDAPAAAPGPALGFLGAGKIIIVQAGVYCNIEIY
jgi:hypothetical protein